MQLIDILMISPSRIDNDPIWARKNGSLRKPSLSIVEPITLKATTHPMPSVNNNRLNFIEINLLKKFFIGFISVP